MIVHDHALFLFRQEKSQKKPSKGALRANRAPFTIPRRIAGSANKIGRAARALPVVVPDIFLGLTAFVSYRPLPLARLISSATGSVRLAPRRQQQGASLCRHVVRTSCGIVNACGWGSQGRVQFVARERGISASPVPISLVTFLFGDKKVT